MRMNTVHDHLNLHLVSLIDEILQVIRSACPRGSCKKVCYMVSKRCIITMLLNRHQLHAVIPNILDSWQHVVCKLPVIWHLAFMWTLFSLYLIFSLPCQHVPHISSNSLAVSLSVSSTDTCVQGSRMRPRTRDSKDSIRSIWSKRVLYRLFLRFAW